MVYTRRAQQGASYFTDGDARCYTAVEVSISIFSMNDRGTSRIASLHPDLNTTMRHEGCYRGGGGGRGGFMRLASHSCACMCMYSCACIRVHVHVHVHVHVCSSEPARAGCPCARLSLHDKVNKQLVAPRDRHSALARAHHEAEEDSIRTRSPRRGQLHCHID